MVDLYYSSRKSTFIPKGYLSLEQVIIRLAEVWFYENLTDFFAWANKDAGERTEETDDHRRYDRLAHETFNRLRQHFYDKSSVAQVIRPQNGKLAPVPAEYWGCEDADRVIYQGAIPDEYDHDVLYSGRVVLPEGEVRTISGLKDNRPVKQSTSHGLPISYSFTRRIPHLKIPPGYICLDDAYDAFAAQAKATTPPANDVDGDHKRFHAIQEDTSRKMLSLLKSGVISSYEMITSSGFVYDIKPEAWNLDGGISKLFKTIWHPSSGYPPIVSSQTPNAHKTNAWVLVSADDVAVVLSGVAEPETQNLELELEYNNENVPKPEYAAEEDKITNGAGRPPVFDRDVFPICAFEVILDNDDKIPEKKTIHAQKAIDKYAEKNNGAKPSPSWAKPIIAKMWSVMGVEERNGNAKID